MLLVREISRNRLHVVISHHMFQLLPILDCIWPCHMANEAPHMAFSMIDVPSCTLESLRSVAEKPHERCSEKDVANMVRTYDVSRESHASIKVGRQGCFDAHLWMFSA